MGDELPGRSRPAVPPHPRRDVPALDGDLQRASLSCPKRAHARTRQNFALRALIAGEHETTALHGHRVIGERTSSLEQQSRAETRIGEMEGQLLRAVSTLVVEQEDGHRLRRSRRGEAVRDQEARAPVLHVPGPPVQLREPAQSPAGAVRKVLEDDVESRHAPIDRRGDRTRKDRREPYQAGGPLSGPRQQHAPRVHALTPVLGRQGRLMEVAGAQVRRRGVPRSPE